MIPEHSENLPDNRRVTRSHRDDITPMAGANAILDQDQTELERVHAIRLLQEVKLATNAITNRRRIPR